MFDIRKCVMNVKNVISLMASQCTVENSLSICSVFTFAGIKLILLAKNAFLIHCDPISKYFLPMSSKLYKKTKIKKEK